MIYSYNTKFYREMVSESEDSADRYGGWHKIYKNTYLSTSLAFKTDVPDVHSTVCLANGNVGFLVWMELNEGDSFGEALGETIRSVAIVQTKEVAEELVKLLKIDIRKPRPNIRPGPLRGILSDGQEILEQRSWEDYCTSVRSINIAEVTLGVL
jgi:hypothetical protein